jgi:acetyl-CoA carboxylase biotin carboxyl carrier protein
MSGLDNNPTGPALGELEILIEEFRQSGLRELHARCGELEVYLSQDADASGLDGPRTVVSTSTASAPAVPVAAKAVPTPAASTPAHETSGTEIMVTAPYLGTFYRSPKPGSAPYVEIGDSVSAEAEVCLVEVMKLFTAVRAGAAGKIVRVLASDGDLVSSGQPLFVIQPE